MRGTKVGLFDRVMRRVFTAPLVSTAAHRRMRRRLGDSTGFSEIQVRYESYTSRQRELFYFRYFDLFYNNVGDTVAGDRWKIVLPTGEVTFPLRHESIGFDWSTVVSVLGHDVEIKNLYLDLLAGNSTPDLFIDVGANFGTHSVLFLASGVQTISVEPNPACHEYFRLLCCLNGITPDLRALAVGNEAGMLELTYPEGETWLATADPEEARRFADRTNILRLTVPVVRLDTLLPDVAAAKNILLKIDVEGLEIHVLQGASQLIREKSPVILFESNDGRNRPALYAAFIDLGYCIGSLSRRGRRSGPLSLQGFLTHQSTNFRAWRRK